MASASKPIRRIEVAWDRDRLQVVLPRSASPKLADLKTEISAITSIPYEQIKLVYCGMIMKDDRATLERFGLRDGSRVMLIGTKGGVPLQGDTPGQKQSSSHAGAREAQDQAARSRKQNEEDLSEGGLLKRIQDTVQGVRTDLLPEVEQFERSTLALGNAASAPSEQAVHPPTQNGTPAGVLTPPQLAFEHRKLSELLLRSLLTLDGVQVNSDMTRAARKAAVKEVQALLDRVDANWTKAKTLGVA
ncbi:hypothetical protein K437DRAFT_265938 [Tilletiaria anomala UBC 951]|uniref:Uncharacterized protein n=1 Tax=Tilletiaria anomala (strain ATCC 24038 / CBS 436.72 / UBC 951) TaxID=1037660 RepID=A0A066WHK3_TILAU|nr:uncharacterized protein K437DRAFT_265938 [Tilletiaria anomala UBC 951]KDN53286.1 hypothetical protein K437DRAFT_265938 [Tilletiaria anomala UBC 951]